MDLRCFVAIALPEPIRGAIARGTSAMRRSGSDVRWVPTGNLHITLKFLGDTPEGVVFGPMREALKRAVAGHAGFTLNLRGAGVFPSESRPRVLWAGAHDGGQCEALALSVQRELAGLGFEPDERPFRPHITIGRLRSQRARRGVLREIQGLSDEEFGTVEVAEIVLMKSELRPSGAVHSTLYAIPLGKP